VTGSLATNLAKCWTHDLSRLVEAVKLKDDLDAATRGNPRLETNWRTVKDWTERSRYNPADRQKAKDLVAAIGDGIDGVLPWLKHYW